MTDAERERIVVEWNRTAVAFPNVAPLGRGFEAQVDRTPDAVAVLADGRGVTYRALDEAANRLARCLRGEGLVPGAPVGICVDRTPDLIVAVLAVLKAGGAYVPLDPEYPPARLAYMLENSQAALLLANDRRAPLFEGRGVRVYNLDRERRRSDAESAARLADGPGLDDLAYVIYTSGSTGAPKGVAMPHRPLANLIAWQLGGARVGAGARTLQFAPLSFDVSFQEIFATLWGGGTLVLIADDERLDPARLAAFVTRHRVERLFLPFVALQYLAEVVEEQNLVPAPLREVVTAGEQLKITRQIVGLFQRLPGAVLVNQYGPTEAHVVTAWTLEGAPDTWPELPPIGRPIANARIYLLDAHGAPVPLGAAGELYIGGVCPARGYLHRPDLTAERFVPDPFAGQPDARLYRTGDLARYRADGALEFLGRADDQVKVRGYRIELGEIEAALGRHPAVKQAVVVARGEAAEGKRLLAYVLPEPGHEAELTGLRDYLRARLPDYMLPAAIATVPAFPLTPSGKVDRRGLPEPPRERPALAREYAPPRGAGETAMAALWQELLHVDMVGADDSFFDLGGNSLLSLKFLARLRRERGVDVPVAAFFEHPTLRSLAAWLEARAGAETAAGSARPGPGRRARGSIRRG